MKDTTKTLPYFKINLKNCFSKPKLISHLEPGEILQSNQYLYGQCIQVTE